jgi:hypothetical protein
MRNKIREEARYRLALSTAIGQNAEVMARALLCTDQTCLSYQLAAFLLKEARWAEEDFFVAYVSGELDD